MPLDDFINNETLTGELLINFILFKLTSFNAQMDFLIKKFEEKYNFNLSELNETNVQDLPGYNDLYAPICDSPYVFINKTTAFNPDAPIPIWKTWTPPWSKATGSISKFKKYITKYI